MSDQNDQEVTSVDFITAYAAARTEASHRIWAIITQDEDEFNFSLVRGDSLENDALLYGAPAYVFLTNIRWGVKKFYTVFDDGSDGMPDDRYPFAGMLSVFTAEEEANELGGEKCIWVRGEDDVYRAFDLTEWTDYQPDPNEPYEDFTKLTELTTVNELS
jgi:hypothetical protein